MNSNCVNIHSYCSNFGYLELDNFGLTNMGIISFSIFAFLFVNTNFCKFVFKSSWGEKPKKALRDGLEYKQKDSNQVAFQMPKEKRMHK